MGLSGEMAPLFGLLELGYSWLVLNNRLLSRIVSLLFAIERISAFIIIISQNIIILPKGYESSLLSMPILFMAFSISLLLTGPGRFLLNKILYSVNLFPEERKCYKP